MPSNRLRRLPGRLIEWCVALAFLAGGITLIWYIRHWEEVSGGAEQTPPAEQIRIERRGHSVRVALSSHVLELSGITTAVVRREVRAQHIAVPARLRFPPGKAVHLVSPFRARVGELLCSVGGEVRRGDPAIELVSDELVRIKAELRAAAIRRDAAAAAYDRLVSLRKSQLVPEQELLDAHRELRDAEAALDRARETLLGWGLTKQEVERVLDGEDSAGRFRLRSPIDGVVMDICVVPGEAVTEGQELLYVADPSKLWAELAADEAVAAHIRPGAVTVFRLRDDTSGAAGEVVFVAPEVDPVTRKVRVLVAIDNADGRYRAEMYGTALVEIEPARERLLVPAAAIQKLGQQTFAFVQVADGEFELRAVKVRTEIEGDVELESGLSEGEKVVVEGAYLLFAELLKRDAVPRARAQTDDRAELQGHFADRVAAGQPESHPQD